ncbi:hypothetical protein Pyn_13974 [Prunus yedoensis var. nudiflora]|uniref:Uncharacterized protein n=1 Tax=Prunus yedoensis var. nudiflora TaxID=2094558 RepID=A0A314XZK3_PRUYE|nr:hypothetical protein Pyn_13974 [Prunus yedoensis var. nudiflora]
MTKSRNSLTSALYPLLRRTHENISQLLAAGSWRLLCPANQSSGLDCNWLNDDHGVVSSVWKEGRKISKENFGFFHGKVTETESGGEGQLFLKWERESCCFVYYQIEKVSSF